MRKACVFFDRDGIVNSAPTPEEYYVLKLSQFHIIPEFFQALRIVNKRNYAAVIATNQKCVHKGLITPEGLEIIHDYLREMIAEAGLSLLDIYACPHGDGHPDRKPYPGMLLRAAHDHRLDLASSWMIGDSERDIIAGCSAGCKAAVLVKNTDTFSVADFRLKSMRELPGFFQEHLQR